MHSISRSQKVVSAIIPAYEEAATIASVVRTCAGAKKIGEVIVVDDGSKDKTAARAKKAGARVISLPQNMGKAGAMAEGAKAAKYPILFFCDADIHGLTPAAIDFLVEPVINGTLDMHVAIQDRGLPLLNLISEKAPLLSGIRAMRREVWESVPEEHRKRFQIEVAINYFSESNGYKSDHIVLPHLGQRIKEEKRGLVKGFRARVEMIRDLLAISSKLYIVERAKTVRAKRTVRRTAKRVA